MLNLVIVAIAVLGMLSKAGPTPPPAIDWAMGLLCAGVMFTLGVRFDDWLIRLAARPPRWRKVRRSRQARAALQAPH